MLIIRKPTGFLAQHATARHKQLVVTVDQNIFNRRILQQVFQRPQARQFAGQRLHDLAYFLFVDGHPFQPNKAGQFDANKILYGLPCPATKLGSQLFDASQQMFMGLFPDLNQVGTPTEQ